MRKLNIKYKLRPVAIRTLPSKNYKKVLEVLVPTRFYWTEEGFDGLEFGPFPKGTSKYQLQLFSKLLDNLNLEQGKPTPVPQVFTKAFDKGEE